MDNQQNEYVRACSWCAQPDKQRAFIGGQWRYMPTDVLAHYQITHGICPVCAAQIIKEMSEEQQQKYASMGAMQEPVA